jgi:hypothetical protein
VQVSTGGARLAVRGTRWWCKAGSVVCCEEAVARWSGGCGANIPSLVANQALSLADKLVRADKMPTLCTTHVL